ncbi:hypothetical protein [Devosia lucknowensis]|nr:hypothetical protein [Devosia lucknowensis]
MMVLMAHPDVHELREQQKLPQFRFDGRIVTHFMDILVTWRSGRRTAFSVKYEADQSTEFIALLQAAADQVGDHFAHDYRTLSEADINRTQVWNAARILSAAKDHDYEAQQALIASLKTGPRQVRVGDCDAMLGDGVRGSRAAMALIKTGKLILPEDHRLSRDAILRNLFTN